MLFRIRGELFLAAMLVGLAGCPAQHARPQEAKLVSLAELEQETAHLPRFSYLGTDSQFHYFKTDGGTYYQLPKGQWRPADEELYPIAGVEALPELNEPGFESYVAARGGQIVPAPLP